MFGRTCPLNPEEVAAALVFVPTRRAAEALTAAFAASATGRAQLLPRVVPLGDEERLGDLGRLGVEDPALAPEIPELERKIQLFQLIDKWRAAVVAARGAAGPADPFQVAASRSDAFALASDLARLIDETIIEDVPLARLAEARPQDFRPERHDLYWSMTARFLSIAATAWPDILENLGVLDASERLKRRLRALSEHAAARFGARPVAVLGSTGSVAATADLMAAVARLPLGAVVLPGLDLTLDGPSWDLVGAETAELSSRFGHPQALIKRTLAHIGMPRDEVARLPVGAEASPRERLLSEVFRPAETTALWRRTGTEQPDLEAALAGITLIEAADAGEEALAIALALRETVSHPGKTAALVTPDRELARAVEIELDRWGITVADSAGAPLSATPVAALAGLALAAARREAGAVDLLALLRHPLCRLGLGEAARAEAVSAIEIAALRGRRLRGGAAGLVPAMERAIAAGARARDPLPRRRLTAEALDQAFDLARRLGRAVAAFARLWSAPVSLRAAAAAHSMLISALMEPAAGNPPPPDSEAGRALAAIFADIAALRSDGPDLDAADYRGIFDQMVAGVTVHAPRPAHPRIKIWGLLEARLLAADRLVCAGLDEGIWPPEARSDPFLNRPMRLALGLAPPERRIGQSAHDLMMLLGAPEVILTRAKKRAGAPAIASRFLRRLMAYAGAGATGMLRARGAPWLDWARRLDAPSAVRAALRPGPVVPPALMPPRLSLTEIEPLYRDPYVIFARRVLKLDVLEPVDPPLDARERGTLIHDVLADYVRHHAGTAGPEAEAALRALGREAFAGVAAEDPEAVEFWWRRFAAFVPWFVAWDAERRHLSRETLVETDGALTLDLAHGHRLTLSTRADRLERRADGSLAILDYKTGQPPGQKEVLSGRSPQVTLTAALAARGAFPALGSAGAGRDLRLGYLRVAGPRGEGAETAIEPRKEPIDHLVERQFEALKAHLNDYLDGRRGFLAHRMPRTRDYAGDYDHLSRHLEWSLGGEADGEET